ncbi:glycosyltransferase [Nocardioides sp. HDW12B]|nr:glycosyltransferase [Nocardioides sp. HDW12B]
MMAGPIVSVIIPAYNAAAHLPACVASVQAQSHAAFELMIVNDGSTDATPALCDELASQDPRIISVHKMNGGLSDARNAGLDRATGRYVLFLDADDWMEKDTLERMVEAAEVTLADVVVAGAMVDFRSESGLVTRSAIQIPVTADTDAEALRAVVGVTTADFVNLLGYAWNKLYRLDRLRTCGVRFEEGTSLIEDVIFNATLCRAGARFSFVAAAFVHYQQFEHQTLGTKYYAEYFQLRCRAVRALCEMLTTWELSTEYVGATRQRLTVRAAVTSAKRPERTGSWLRCACAFSRRTRSRSTRDCVALGRGFRGLSRREKLGVLLLQSSFLTPVLFAVARWDRSLSGTSGR